jgi:hypothetical protein
MVEFAVELAFVRKITMVMIIYVLPIPAKV